jgi:hypothetical protein
LISNYGYGTFVLHHFYMEIFHSDFWSIDNAAQNLERLKWNMLSTVNLCIY